jgi:uncharacterized SAM-binding protein YcdF (DUF218 family)
MVIKINSRYSHKIKQRPLSNKRNIRNTSNNGKKTNKSKPYFKFMLVIGLFLLTITSWFIYQIIRGYLLQPQAILVLGGHEEREIFAAKFAQNYPNLPIWVSGGSPSAYAHKIFAKQGINGDRLKLDYHAVDTLTNFTTLIDQLKAAGIKNVFLITSANHLYRAEIIGLIVFGTQGITIHPIAVPSQGEPESLNKCLRDALRAVIWVFTGETGANLKLEEVNHQSIN